MRIIGCKFLEMINMTYIPLHAALTKDCLHHEYYQNRCSDFQFRDKEFILFYYT